VDRHAWRRPALVDFGDERLHALCRDIAEPHHSNEHDGLLSSIDRPILARSWIALQAIFRGELGAQLVGAVCLRRSRGTPEEKERWLEHMGDRKQRVKGKAETVKGKAKAKTGRDTGRGSTEAKGVAEMAKGKARQTAGKASSKVKKATR
jgi:uncharacterized protein YjbJ (UPF0337 family)